MLPAPCPLIQATRFPAIATWAATASTPGLALPYLPWTTEVAPVAVFHTWIRPPLAYATREPSMASVQIGAEVFLTVFSCDFAAPAAGANTSRAGASNNPVQRRLFMTVNLIPDC